MSITAKRREREKKALRAKILDEAWQIVKRDGWQSLSIRKIADAIEYSVPVIYDHFENKDAILVEFGRKAFDVVVRDLNAAKALCSDPEEQLKAIANAYWNFAFEHKEYYQLMWGLNIPGCELSQCIPERSVFSDLVMDPIIQVMKRGRKKEGEACLKYHTFWSILHGLISIKMVAPPDNTEELNKWVLKDAIDGFIKNLRT